MTITKTITISTTITLFVLLVLFVFYNWSRLYSYVILKSYNYEIEKLQYLSDDLFATIKFEADNKEYTVMIRANYQDYFTDYIDIEMINNESLIGISCSSAKSELRQNKKSQYIPALNYFHGIILEKHPTKNRFNIRTNGISDLLNVILKVDSIFSSVPEFPTFDHYLEEGIYERYSTRISFNKHKHFLDSLGLDHKSFIFSIEECNCE